MGFFKTAAKAVDASAEHLANRAGRGKVVESTRRVVDGCCAICGRPTKKQNAGLPCCGRTPCLRNLAKKF